MENVVKVLDKAWVRLKLQKCEIAKRNTEWLGYKLSEEGINPVEEKVQAITDKLWPKNLKDLRSFMAAKNQMNQFIPNLANLCAHYDHCWKMTKSGVGKKRTKKLSTK